jgi:hypothetical protein
LRTRPGEGGQEFIRAVSQKRFGCPDLDVYRSQFEPLSPRLGALVVESLLLGYKGIEGGFEEL